MGVKDSMTTFFVKQIADYLAKDPEQNADRMFNIARKLTKNPQHLEQIGQVQEAITKDGNWKEYYHRIMRELDPKVRNTFIINYFVKSCLIGVPMQHENAAKIGGLFLLTQQIVATCVVQVVGLENTRRKTTLVMNY